VNDSPEMAMPEKRHPIDKINITANKIKGLEDFGVDEEVEIRLKVKVLKPMGHGSTWDKEDLKKPLEGEYEILSGKAFSIQDKIDKAETIDELDEAVD
jgi:hypothetical protein